MFASHSKALYACPRINGGGGGGGWGEGVLPNMGHIGMCSCEGYDFQAVYRGIGYINQRVWI